MKDSEPSDDKFFQSISEHKTNLNFEPHNDSLKTAVDSIPQRFEVLSELGRGGMGTVWKCRDKRLGRIVAIKAILPELGSSESARQRFVGEGQAIAKMSDHPSIVTLYEMEESNKHLFLVMKYIDGETLADRIRRKGVLALDETVSLIEPIFAALQFVHNAPFIHRDIKPENVLVAKNDTAYLADFGLAKLVGIDSNTVTGQVVGSFRFMAPEQSSGSGELTSAADQWSLGATIYNMLSGQVPYPPEFDELPAQIREIVRKSMRRRPSQRYSSVEEFGREFCRAAASHPTESVTTNVENRQSRAGEVVVKVPGFEGSDRGEVVEILVSVGDRVEKSETLIEIESEKSTVVVPSMISGFVISIFVSEGEMVRPGQICVVLSENRDYESHKIDVHNELPPDEWESGGTRKKGILRWFFGE